MARPSLHLNLKRDGNQSDTNPHIYPFDITCFHYGQTWSIPCALCLPMSSNKENMNIDLARKWAHFEREYVFNQIFLRTNLEPCWWMPARGSARSTRFVCVACILGMTVCTYYTYAPYMEVSSVLSPSHGKVAKQSTDASHGKPVHFNTIISTYVASRASRVMCEIVACVVWTRACAPSAKRANDDSGSLLALWRVRIVPDNYIPPALNAAWKELSNEVHVRSL